MASVRKNLTMFGITGAIAAALSGRCRRAGIFR